MTIKASALTALVTYALLGTQAGSGAPQAPQAQAHSRRAWHRVALFGSNVGAWPSAIGTEPRARVLILTRDGHYQRLRQKLEALSATVEFADEPSGYFRAVVKATQFNQLARDESIENWQLAGTSFARDHGHYERPEQLFTSADQDTSQAIARIEPAQDVPPIISSSEARQWTELMDERMGVNALRQRHPTFDGRGATIAIVEGAAPGLPLDHPLLQRALTAEGRQTRKVEAIGAAIDIVREGQPRTFGVRPLIAQVVALSAPSMCRSTVCAFEGSRYLVPPARSYRLGTWLLQANESSGPSHIVRILRTDSGDIRFDLDNDLNFVDEAVVRDFNRCTDNACGRVTVAGTEYLISEESDPQRIIVHPAIASHAVMVATVAAGDDSTSGYGRGVAPGARLVAISSEQDSLHSDIEAFIHAARIETVDVISSSTHYLPENTHSETLSAQVLDRIIVAYGKPIVIPAGNQGGGVSTDITLGSAKTLVVGGLELGPVVRAVVGHTRAEDEWVELNSTSRGPAQDGRLKPDFVVPNRRVSGRPCDAALRYSLLIGKRLPPCFSVSNGTSAAAPALAGLLALLASGIKQTGQTVDIERLLWAIKASATPVDGAPTIAQGLGVPNVERAWDAYFSNLKVHAIVAQSSVRHRMDAYLADRDSAPGFFERENWTVGQTGERSIVLTRTAGPAEQLEFDLRIRGDVAAFRVPRAVSLPLNEPVKVHMAVKATNAGVNSGILEIRPTGSRVATAYVSLVVVGAETRAEASIAGEFGPKDGRLLFSRIGEETGVLRVDVDVSAGSALLGASSPNGRTFSPPSDLLPQSWNLPKRPGKYTLLIPEPQPGTWSWDITNHETAVAPRTVYRLRLTSLRAQLAAAVQGDRSDVRVTITKSNLKKPQLHAETGYMEEFSIPYFTDGLPTIKDINVPEGTLTLLLAAVSDSADTGVEATLYDCTRGHCVLFDDRLPAHGSATFRMVRPKSGLWRLIVGPGPKPISASHFRLSITTTDLSAVTRLDGERAHSWIVSPASPERSSTNPKAIPAMLVGLADQAAEDAEHLNPMGPLSTLSNRPAFVTFNVIPLNATHAGHAAHLRGHREQDKRSIECRHDVIPRMSLHFSKPLL